MNNINDIFLCMEKHTAGVLKYNFVQKKVELPTCALPALYLLYIKSYIGCCSPLIRYEMICTAACEDAHAMDRRKHSLNST